MATQADPRQRGAGRGAANLLALGLAAGLLGGAALAAWRLHPYLGEGFPRVFLHGTVQSLNQALPWGLALAACWGAISWSLGDRFAILRLGRGVPRRTTHAAIAALAALWIVANAAALIAQRQNTRPNVIVLLIDVLRADHLGVYGYDRPTSPNIDRFAADAILFSQAVSQSTFTKTSVASLFTGLYPHHHGVYRGDKKDTADRVTSDVLSPELTTLAESLRAQGLFTTAWVMNGHLRAYMGFDQGYVDYHDQPGYMRRIQASWRDWRSRLGRIDPFFAYFHFQDLHAPNIPKPEYDGIYGRYSEDWASMSGEVYKPRRDAIRRRELVPDAAAVEQLRADYDAVLTHVDAKIGTLLEDLEADGLYDESMILLMADHGDAFMEHGVIAHSWIPHEELIRVPLIVKLPHSRHAGRRVDAQVRLVDVAPTLIEFAGGSAPPELDGVSLMPFLYDTQGEAPPAYAVSEHGKTLAVRTEDRKYIRLQGGLAEFYDLRTDPTEQRNLIESHAAETLPFAEIARRAVAARKGRKVDEVVVDPETVKALRALGYMD